MPTEPTAGPPPARSRSGLIADAEALLATFDAAAAGSRAADEPSPQTAELERFRTSSEAERAAAAAARVEEQRWLSHEVEQARELAKVASAAAALGAELGTVARATVELTGVAVANGSSQQHRHKQQQQQQQQQQQRHKEQQQQVRGETSATREKDDWVSGTGASRTPRDYEPEWRRTARRASEEREAAELAKAAARSIHRRKLSRAEQQRRFEELQRATLRSERKRREAREQEEARRRETLQRQQVHFAKKANWSSLLDRLYVPPKPSSRRRVGQPAHSDKQRASAKVARTGHPGSPLLQPFGSRHGESKQMSAETQAEIESDTDTIQAARRAMLDWDMATTIERLTAELEEREAELAQQHDIIDGLVFKLRAVCSEGLRRGHDLESWLEDSWEQVEYDRQKDRDTPRVRREELELRRREFIAEAEAEQRRRSFLLESNVDCLPLSQHSVLASPVLIDTGDAGSPAAE